MRSRSVFFVAFVCLLLSIPGVLADQNIANWKGNFAPCNGHSELLKHGSMNLGVRISTSNPELGREFERAISFWSHVVDMSWHEDQTSTCAIELVDGTPTIFKNAMIARSQFTEWQNFQGWIAFDPRAPLTKTDMYLTAVHEIGHMLGLKHNPDAKSIMYYIDLEGPEVLDATDINSLAAHHKLRVTASDAPIAVNRHTLSTVALRADTAIR